MRIFPCMWYWKKIISPAQWDKKHFVVKELKKRMLCRYKEIICVILDDEKECKKTNYSNSPVVSMLAYAFFMCQQQIYYYLLLGAYIDCRREKNGTIEFNEVDRFLDNCTDKPGWLVESVYLWGQKMSSRPGYYYRINIFNNLALIDFVLSKEDQIYIENLLRDKGLDVHIEYIRGSQSDKEDLGFCKKKCDLGVMRFLVKIYAMLTKRTLIERINN